MTDPRETARGAVILPFPAPASAPRPAIEPPALRLERAMQQLAGSLEGLRHSVALYRAAIGDLGGAMQGLGATTACYQESLRRLDDRVADLRGQARQLEQWAERATTTPELQ